MLPPQLEVALQSEWTALYAGDFSTANTRGLVDMVDFENVFSYLWCVPRVNFVVVLRKLGHLAHFFFYTVVARTIFKGFQHDVSIPVDWIYIGFETGAYLGFRFVFRVFIIMNTFLTFRLFSPPPAVRSVSFGFEYHAVFNIPEHLSHIPSPVVVLSRPHSTPSPSSSSSFSSILPMF